MQKKLIKIITLVMLFVILVPVNAYALTITDNSAEVIPPDSELLNKDYDHEMYLFDNNICLKYSYNENCSKIDGIVIYKELGGKLIIKKIDYSRPTISYLPYCKKVYVKLGSALSPNTIGCMLHLKVDYKDKELKLYAHYNKPDFPYTPYDNVVKNLYNWK
ncbi:hypothetical protein PV797_11795 [Clostridiaceae bacterium M8S5]|nr:hypothetical protein PV797_11795 [Clostridiaceae bacterium M8S5]